MPQTFYELLGIAPTAPADEIKRAFRQQIALYHPDKVHHLGKEFQDMAAERAAALTEAYRILSNEERRAEYDRALTPAGAPPAAATAPQQGAPAEAPPRPAAEAGAAEAPAADAASGQKSQFHTERVNRDLFVRKATMTRFQHALDAVAGDYERSQAPGFDIACVPRSKLFSRAKGPKLLGRFVPRVDGPAVTEAWTRAGQWSGADETCVFLMGSSLAPASELAKAIAEQRRKSSRARLTLIPVDARDWEAHVPVDAPGIAKTLLARLRSGA